MFKQIIFVGAFAVVALAEVPVSGPYPPSGWRPQGASFNLPREYLPASRQQPKEVEQPVQVEITEEKVEFAGQFDTTTVIPSNAYLPPFTTDHPEEEVNNDDFLKVQGLPSRDSAQQFNDDNSIQVGQLNQGEFIPKRPQSLNKQQFRQPRPQPQAFGRIQQKTIIQRPILAKQQAVPAVPANQYGVPEYTEDAEPEIEERLPSSSTFEQADQNQGTNGQYYILTPDRTLQRVAFKTSQNEEETRTNGFTAQLRYMPIEDIKDPIYTYNAQGQLVRIFKK